MDISWLKYSHAGGANFLSLCFHSGGSTNFGLKEEKEEKHKKEQEEMSRITDLSTVYELSYRLVFSQSCCIYMLCTSVG